MSDSISGSSLPVVSESFHPERVTKNWTTSKPSHRAPSTKVVVVEDDQDDAFMLVRQLKKAQLDSEVTLFSNGFAALNHLLETSQPPLVVFLDLELPGVNGIELLQRIRDVRRLRTLPVIVMTGSINPKDEAICLQLGVTAYLAKPVSLEIFNKNVGHLFPDRALVQPS